MKIESEILKDSMLAASENGAKVFRNNTGTAWQGDVVRLRGGDILIKNARIVHFGLCTGSSDLIGWRPVKITQGMVGQTIAQFVAVECKTPSYNRASKDQKNFLAQVRKAGGVAVIARREGEDGVSFEEVGEC